MEKRPRRRESRQLDRDLDQRGLVRVGHVEGVVGERESVGAERDAEDRFAGVGRGAVSLEQRIGDPAGHRLAVRADLEDRAQARVGDEEVAVAVEDQAVGQSHGRVGGEGRGHRAAFRRDLVDGALVRGRIERGGGHVEISGGRLGDAGDEALVRRRRRHGGEVGDLVVSERDGHDLAGRGEAHVGRLVVGSDPEPLGELVFRGVELGENFSSGSSLLPPPCCCSSRRCWCSCCHRCCWRRCCRRWARDCRRMRKQRGAEAQRGQEDQRERIVDAFMGDPWVKPVDVGRPPARWVRELELRHRWSPGESTPQIPHPSPVQGRAARFRADAREIVRAGRS